MHDEKNAKEGRQLQETGNFGDGIYKKIRSTCLIENMKRVAIVSAVRKQKVSREEVTRTIVRITLWSAREKHTV